MPSRNLRMAPSLLVSLAALSALVPSAVTSSSTKTTPVGGILSAEETEQHYLDVVTCEMAAEEAGGGSCWYAVAADIAARRHELTRRLVALTKLQAEFMRRGQVSPDAVSIRAKATFLDMLAIALRDSSNVQIPVEIAELRDHSPPLPLSSFPFSE